MQPAQQSGAEVEAHPRIVVDDADDLVFEIRDAGGSVGGVALRGDAVVPVVIRSCGFLNLDRLQPGVFAWRLVEMAMDAHIAGLLGLVAGSRSLAWLACVRRGRAFISHPTSSNLSGVVGRSTLRRRALQSATLQGCWVGVELAARSQARQRYQLATEHQGCHFWLAAPFRAGVGEVGGHDLGGWLEAEEGEGEAFADAVVGVGRTSGRPRRKISIICDGPAADAADLGQVFDDGFVGHAADAGEGGNGAVEGLGGEVAEGEGLVVGEAGGAKLLVGAVEQVLRAKDGCPLPAIAGRMQAGAGGWRRRPCRGAAGR